MEMIPGTDEAWMVYYRIYIQGYGEEKHDKYENKLCNMTFCTFVTWDKKVLFPIICIFTQAGKTID